MKWRDRRPVFKPRTPELRYYNAAMSPDAPYLHMGDNPHVQGGGLVRFQRESTIRAAVATWRMADAEARRMCRAIGMPPAMHEGPTR